jgi:L-asparaginase
MARVVALFTGGTISMQADGRAGGNVPRLDGRAILALASDIDPATEVEVVDVGRTPASHFTFPVLFHIAARIRAAQADPTVAGIVVVQGTDVIEETAFLWDLVLGGPQPIVVTGAMRTSDAPDFDGGRNLRDAFTVATSMELRGQGVVVVLNGEIHAADAVTKVDTTAFDTFRSLDEGPLGRVVGGRVVLERRRGPRRQVRASSAAERVPIVTCHVAMDGRLIRAARTASLDGLVVAATGAGNTAPDVLAAAREVMADGTPVVLASRAPSGAVSPTYAFPGGGATWLAAGAIPAGHLGPAKARIALAVGLGARLDATGLRHLLADPPTTVEGA